MLYRLSYVGKIEERDGALSSANGRGRIRTSEGVCQLIYSQFPLATWVPAPIQLATLAALLNQSRADEENRTPNLLITSELLCRLSYVGLADGYYTKGGKAVKWLGVRQQFQILHIHP